MNTVALVGRLTRDPELRTLENLGSSVVRFTLAVDKGLSKQKRTEMEQAGKPTADFINCVAWGARADTIAQYVRKGQQLAVSGRIETGSYENDEGQRVYTTDVNVSDFTFISSQGDTNNAPSSVYTPGDTFDLRDYGIEDNDVPF